MQVIIFRQDNGVPAVISPAPECLKNHSVLEIAIKDVPFGKKFKIIDAEDLPQEYPQEAWLVSEEDLTDGVGNESNQFEGGV